MEISSNRVYVKERFGFTTIIFDTRNTEMYIDYIKQSGIKNIVVDTSTTYLCQDLSPLMPVCDILESLEIYGEDFNYDKIKYFSNLKILSISYNKKEVIDLKNFPNLEDLNCVFTKKIVNMSSCENLKSLRLLNYNPSTKDLHEIPAFHNLLNLGISFANIHTLSGIENLSSLKKFEIWRAPNLQTISSLIPLSQSIETLFIESCKKITDYEIVGNLKLLKKLRISDSGEIQNLSFIKQLKDLDFLSFWGTKVLDGDISHCEGIKFVGFDDKRHYNRKSKDFEDTNIKFAPLRSLKTMRHFD